MCAPTTRILIIYKLLASADTFPLLLYLVSFPLYLSPMQIQCPQCRSLITLDGQTLMGEELLCCAQCRMEIRINLSASLPAAEESTNESAFRINVSTEQLAELATESPKAPTAPPPRGTLLWALANLGLILLLVGQYAYFMRNDLARYQPLRPWLETLCQYAQCRLPLQRDLQRIKVVARDLRPHPTVADGLVITITILNEAPFPQPFPKLDLSFYDLDHRLLARRAFPPQLYLPPGVDMDGGLQPGTPLPITLELVDPGKMAVNFEFEFL